MYGEAGNGVEELNANLLGQSLSVKAGQGRSLGCQNVPEDMGLGSGGGVCSVFPGPQHLARLQTVHCFRMGHCHI